MRHKAIHAMLGTVSIALLMLISATACSKHWTIPRPVLIDRAQTTHYDAMAQALIIERSGREQLPRVSPDHEVASDPFARSTAVAVMGDGTIIRPRAGQRATGECETGQATITNRSMIY
jgi:hypothetical protein